MVIATRRAAWRDGPENGWHDDLVWYAAAIHRMRELTPGFDDFVGLFADLVAGRPAPADWEAELAAIARQWADPRSLGYQSQVHGTYAAKPDWPTRDGQPVLWQECAHSHWFFLPWHRAYLLEFETVVRGHVVDLGGPADWALPYWNYTDHAADPHRLQLPQPLRGETLPAGVTVPGVAANPDGTVANPLFVPGRQGPKPEPDDDSWATATEALLRPHYANQQDTGRVSFGGGVIEQPDDPVVFHATANEMGMLDGRPHGSTHNEVGGLMWAFQTAGLDPVFWMHHANIDRLWQTYADDLGHGFPFTGDAGAGSAARASWTTQKFRFLRADGTVATWTAPEVLDLGALGYGYDSIVAPPLPEVPPEPPPGSGDDPFGLDRAGGPEPAAAAGPTALRADQEVVLSGGDGADPATGLDAFPRRARWLLRFEGIRSARPAPTSYHVFLGLPAGAPADRADGDHYAGLISLFGVAEASREDGTSSGSGQRRLLDVTGVVAAQAATLRPHAVGVRLVATCPDRDIDGAGMSIERISLEFA